MFKPFIVVASWLAVIAVPLTAAAQQRSRPLRRASPTQRRPPQGKPVRPAASHGLRPAARAARPAPGRVAAGRALHRALLRGAGRHLGRSSRRPTSITCTWRQDEHAVAGHLDPVRRERRADHARGFQASAGDAELSRQPVNRSSDSTGRCGLHVPQRHDREDHRLQHGGARAHQDRSRLRGEQEARAVEDRRGAQG